MIRALKSYFSLVRTGYAFTDTVDGRGSLSTNRSAKDIFQAEDHMSDKGYEVASLEDIPKRNDPWDEWKPNKDIQ